MKRAEDIRVSNLKMMRRWLTVLLLLTILPTGVWAQDEDAALMPEGLQGEFTVGGAGVFGDSDSFKFGEYTGINDDTGYVIGSTNLTYFMNLFTEDLGLDNRSIYWETGKTGIYTVYAEYNQIPHLLNNNALTQFIQPGGTNLTLNPGFLRGDLTTDLNIVNRTAEIQNERDTGLFGMKGMFNKFNYDLSYKRTERDGFQSIGGPSGFSGAPPSPRRSVILPDPIDQVAHEIHASLSHNRDEGQIQLTFDYSLFNNSFDSLTWQNTFDNTGPSLDEQSDTNLISRDPDNSSWKVGLSGAYNLTDTTRVSSVFQYGIMEQNESLLPFSTGTTTALLPRLQANAQIQTIHGTFNLSSRPLPKLALNLRYRHYQTINDTPVQGFAYIIADDFNNAQQGPVNNLPFDMTQNQVTATASYYAFKGTNFKLGYKFDHRKRDFREVDETKESAVTAGVRSSYFKNVNFGYNVTLGVREEIDPYDETKINLARFGAATNETHPLMKRFDISERDQMKHSANINFSPTDRTTYGVYYNFVYDDYDTSQLGLQNSQRHDVTFDWMYTPSDATTLNIYYTYENIDTEQLNRNSGATLSTNPADNWTANHDNNTHTVGAGVSHQFAENRVKLSADYWFSDSVEEITFATGSALSTDMPKLKTRTHNARFTGRYRYSPNVDVSLSYLYQRFEIDDFATDNFSPGSAVIPEVLTLFGTLPNFDAHTVMAFFTYRIGATKKQ
jgi:MtrB/PioB family decaheme-associated outer membrane protein